VKIYSEAKDYEPESFTF